MSMETIIRFDMRGGFDTPMWELYAAAAEMAAYADSKGVDVIMLTEHHGVPDGYCPAPTVLAGGLATTTARARIRIASVILPFHHPIAVAEQTLVLDQMSNGRAELAVAAGYVPSEFDMFGRTMRQRPRLLEERLPVLGAALAGEPITVDGHTFTVTPRSVQQPRPPLIVCGGVAESARRAARYGDGFYPLNADPGLRDRYRAECAAAGKPVGPIIDTTGPMFVHVAEDPEREWERVGPHALAEMNSYGRWAAQSTTGEMTSPFREVDDVAAVRAGGLHEIVTVDQCLRLMAELEPAGKSLVLTPLLAGLDPEVAWAGLHLFFEKVLPAYREAGGSRQEDDRVHE